VKEREERALTLRVDRSFGVRLLNISVTDIMDYDVRAYPVTIRPSAAADVCSARVGERKWKNEVLKEWWDVGAGSLDGNG
jgi:hypothetical protein